VVVSGTVVLVVVVVPSTSAVEVEVSGVDVGVTVVIGSSVTPEEQAAATTNTANTEAMRLI
jgi:hypothetical protein